LLGNSIFERDGLQWGIQKAQIDMQVYIITEGSRNIGFGHITRCISLGQAFTERQIYPEFIINGDKDVEGLLKDYPYHLFDWLENENKLFDSLKKADVIIVDSYLADIAFYQKVSDLLKVALFVDDNKRLKYPKGIVLNGAIYADKLGYPWDEKTVYLLGTRYIPIRKDFFNVEDKPIRKIINTVMLTFGGHDFRSMTPKILRVLSEYYPKIAKKVVVGKGFVNLKEIEQNKDSNTEIIFNPNAEEMKNIMLESDIAISAAGQTLYELARVGVPTIAIAVADNQLSNTEGWNKAGVVEDAGWWEDKNILQNIAVSFEKLSDFDVRKNKRDLGRSFVDGKGSLRVADYIIYFVKSNVNVKIGR